MENMRNVIPIHSHRTFSREEAESILPVVRRITGEAAAAVQEMNDRIKFIPADEPMHKRMRADIALAIRRWAIKVSNLGINPRGVWLVDFSAHEGWFSWRIGDENLSFFDAQETHPALDPLANHELLT